MDKDIMLIDDKKEIKQSNRLIESRYCLTKYEQRMMIAICSQLVRNADEFETVRVRVADMANFCNIRGKDKYARVKSTLMRLLGRVIQLKKEKGWYATHWLQSAEYFDEEGVIEYCVDQRLKPELLQLKAAYLSTPTAPLMEFRRDYSARLYFLLKKMLKIHEFEYSLDFFRDRFKLGKTYDKLSNLKNGVIEPALAEINAKSDIEVQHEYIKQGRTYTKIKFVVSLKAKALPAAPEATKPPEASQPSSEPAVTNLPTPSPKVPQAVPEPPQKAIKQQATPSPSPTPEHELERLGQTKLFATPPQPPSSSASSEAEKKKLKLFFDNEVLFAKLSRYFLNQKIEEMIIKYGAERVESNLDYAERNSERKHNMAGWITSCIECDHAAAERAIYVLNKQQAEREREELMARLEPMPKIELDPNDKRSVRERFADLKNDLKKRKG